MYVSLKWKAVVFLSLVLIGITATWTWQTVVKQVDTFNTELAQTHSNNDTLLTELISDSFLKLSQFSQLLSGKRVVSDTISNPQQQQQLTQALEREWLDYNINLGLDYLAIYDSQGTRLGDAHSSDLTFIDAFEATLKEQLELSTKNNEPINFIYCNQACLMVVLEPFINDTGNKGSIALAQNMADIVRVYYDFTQAGIGLLIEANESLSDHLDERFLDSWNTYSWATSNFNTIFPVIRAYSDTQKLGNNPENDLFEYDRRHYLVKPHSIGQFVTLGQPLHFVSVGDKTEPYRLMTTNINRGITTGLLGLIIAAIILWFLINTPMKKLRNVTEALHLLPKQNFDQVIDKVSNQKHYILDELTILEDSTAYVAKELNKLHEEINLKNLSLKEQIDALTRSRSFLTRLFDNSQIFIITQDFGGAIHSTNKKFDTLYKRTPENFERLIYQDHELNAFRDNCEQLKNHRRDVFQQEINLLDKNDKNIVIAWTHTLVEDEQGNEIILSIGMDQTKQKKAENDLRWIADHDSLTGIGNRRSFNLSIDHLLQNDAVGALVFIDVNRFKQINDIYGHTVGDQVLTDIANKLRLHTRGSDKISRFAGDEFTVLLSNISLGTLPNVLEKLSRELNCSIQVNDGRTIQYSVSMGASLFPHHGDDAQTLVVNADMAMYHAKKKGVGQWHIYDINDERATQLKQDHNIMLSVREALKNDSFNLLYQPILNIQHDSVSH
ncbi:diguanylate cyclase, partial [bacterium]|nr:diguanylate cyclase [bacterium]